MLVLFMLNVFESDVKLLADNNLSTDRPRAKSFPEVRCDFRFASITSSLRGQV
jgi:hypothetical protein